MKELFETEDITLDELERMTVGDVKDAASIAFPRNGGPVRGIFLNSPMPVRAKQDAFLPFVRQEEHYAFLFQVNKKRGMILVEYAGSLETTAIQQAVDVLAKKAEQINGGFFPGYRRLIGLPVTVAVGRSASNLNKLSGIENVRDIRLTDYNLVFIANNNEIRTVSLVEAEKAGFNLSAAKSELIHRFDETISCLDRVKNNWVTAVIRGKKCAINISQRTVDKCIIQPALSNLEILAYHEQEDQGRIAVASDNGRRIILFPTQPNQAA